MGCRSRILALLTRVLKILNREWLNSLRFNGWKWFFLKFIFNFLLNFWGHILLILPYLFIDSKLNFAVQSFLLYFDLIIHHIINFTNKVLISLILYLFGSNIFNFGINLDIQRLKLIIDLPINILFNFIIQ